MSKEVLKLEKFKLEDTQDTFVVQVEVLDKMALDNYINENGSTFYCGGIGLNLLDILNDKDTTRITNQHIYDKLVIVVDTFNESFNSTLDNFKELSVDEKLNTIYSLLLGEKE